MGMSRDSNIIIIITKNSSSSSSRLRRRTATEEFVQLRTKLFACDQIHVEVIGVNEYPQSVQNTVNIRHDKPGGAAQGREGHVPQDHIETANHATEQGVDY